MTLSRVSQVEDLANLLAVRRALLRERALRQRAVMRLAAALLNLPETSRELSALSSEPPRAA